MSAENHVLVFAGLGDRHKSVRNMVQGLDRPGLKFYVSEAANWNNTTEGIQPKIKRVIKEVDDLSKNGKVSLIGISGSGSLVGLVFLERRDKVGKIVNVCGRLTSGGIPPLWLTGIRNPSFKESVQTFESKMHELTSEDRSRFLSFQAMLDELVPSAANNLEGIKRITVPAIGHNWGIHTAFSKYGDQITDFLLGN